jgi:hypothetical protein
MKTGRAARPRRGPTLALAAGALLVLGMLAWALNPGPRWRVADTQQADGNVVFDGEPVPAADPEAMNDLLVGGTLLEWRGHGDLELVSPGSAVLFVAPGSVLTLPAPPPRFFGRTSTARLAEGRFHFLPGPRFRGARLVVATPQRTFTAPADRPFAVVHDPSGGTRLVDSGPEIDAFVRRASRLAGANAR